MFTLFGLLLAVCLIIVAVRNANAKRDNSAPVHAKVIIVQRITVFPRVTFELDNGERVTF